MKAVLLRCTITGADAGTVVEAGWLVQPKKSRRLTFNESAAFDMLSASPGRRKDLEADGKTFGVSKATGFTGFLEDFTGQFNNTFALV